MAHHEPESIDAIRRALVEQGGALCFDCIAGNTGLPTVEVTRCLAEPALSGFIFQRCQCAACGNLRSWCAEYARPPEGGTLL